MVPYNTFYSVTYTSFVYPLLSIILGAGACHSAHIEVQGQVCGVRSLLLSHMGSETQTQVVRLVNLILFLSL